MVRGNAVSLFKYEAERCGLDAEWRFRISMRMRVTFGLCFHDSKTIKLNALYIETATDESIRDTILHEIAHALVGPDHGHDRVWRRKALEIGCNGKRCRSDKNFGRHLGHCDKCGQEFTRGKSPEAKVYIGKCDRCGKQCRKGTRPRRGVIYTHIVNGCGGEIVYDHFMRETPTYTHKRCGGTVVFKDRGVQYAPKQELERS